MEWRERSYDTWGRNNQLAFNSGTLRGRIRFAWKRLFVQTGQGFSEHRNEEYSIDNSQFFTNARLINLRSIWSRIGQIVLIIALSFPTLPVASAMTAPPHAQPQLLELATQKPDSIVQVIVQKIDNSGNVEEEVAKLGGIITKDLRIINAFAAQITAKAAVKLARLESVRWVSLDAAMQSTTVSSIDIRVSASSDDVEEEGVEGAHLGQGGMYLNSSDLEMTRDLEAPASGTQMIGLRFNGLAIPRGASISQATLRFRAISADPNNSNSDPANLTIQGQAEDNPGTFLSAAYNLSTRPRTSAAVQWLPSTWVAGTTYETPSLVTIVQEIVNRTGWGSGNSLVFILRCTDGVAAENCGSRSADAWDGNSSNAPLLHIEWSNATPPPATNSEVTLRENFNSNRSENANWSSDSTWSNQNWIEIGENNGSNDGDIAITELLGGSRTGLRIQRGNKGLQGFVNLADVASAALRLGFRRKGLDDSSDYVSILISSNGGSSWSELSRITGPGTDDDLQVIHYDISAYASNVTTIKFVSSASLGGSDKVYIDFSEVEYMPGSGSSSNPPIPSGNLTVRDEFNVTAYDNNDGTGPWLGPWVESGDDSNPNSGDIVIEVSNCPNAGRCLVLDDRSGRSITRSVNLSNSDVATLSYIYSWDRDDGGSIVLEASANGSNWTVLREYTASANGSEQIDLTPYKSANTSIRFRVTSSGEEGQFRVDNIEVVAMTTDNGNNPGTSGTVRDEFSTVSYNNNNGTQPWLNDWAESGDGSPSPSAGYARIASGALYLRYTNRTVSRQANLAGATSATLSLQFKRSGLDGSSDYVALQVSADGGGTWHEIDRFVGPNNDSSYQPRSYDISAYATSNSAIRMVTSSSLGSSDTVYFDNIQIEQFCSDCVNTSNLTSNSVRSIGADQLWNGVNRLQGQGMGVAVVDSGISGHHDLSHSGPGSDSRVKGRVNFSAEQIVLDDSNGHGSHVAGIIAGNGRQSKGAHMGVAPKADLIDIRVTDDKGMSSMSNVIAGLQWIVEHKSQYNIRVVNMSLNSTVAESYHTSPLCAAVEILWFNGIVVVVSAGNNGAATLYPPANDPFAIVVGATDDMGTFSISDDVVAPFSAYGVTVDGFTKPDLVAPGRNIVSLLASDDSNFALGHPANTISGTGGVSYFRMSGTSAAAPVVTGAVALLLQAQPNLTPDQVKFRLMTTANRNWAGYDTAKAGAGYLDIFAAIFSSTSESANTGLQASQLLTTGSDPINSSVNWNSVNWNSVNWNSVNWNSVNWNSVNWNSVNWNSDYWEDGSNRFGDADDLMLHSSTINAPGEKLGAPQNPVFLPLVVR